MSAAISHQPPKDDEEEDDEQGEEFMFDGSTNEEKSQEDSKDISSECITPVHVPKNDHNEPSGAVAADGAQLIKSSPPAESQSIVASVPTSDIPAAESSNERQREQKHLLPR
ncbi:hypothetical protein AMECASPLE_009829 [Ameca splendens]|uniref:Uncharacterized protein n=1 Tax=Ameca splendens TaxID=208324 RepID=A0ABV0ZX04_9TELE